MEAPRALLTLRPAGRVTHADVYMMHVSMMPVSMIHVSVMHVSLMLIVVSMRGVP